jgi:hypothetical protein
LPGHCQIVYLQFIDDYLAGEDAKETDGTDRAYRIGGRERYQKNRLGVRQHFSIPF